MAATRVKVRCIHCDYEGYGDPMDYWCPKCTNPVMLPRERMLVQVPDVRIIILVIEREPEGANHEKE
jgi:Zn finger protein HypA/HybF involved in hydrogenase expression